MGLKGKTINNDRVSIGLYADLLGTGSRGVEQFLAMKVTPADQTSADRLIVFYLPAYAKTELTRNGREISWTITAPLVTFPVPHLTGYSTNLHCLIVINLQLGDSPYITFDITPSHGYDQPGTTEHSMCHFSESIRSVSEFDILGVSEA